MIYALCFFFGWGWMINGFPTSLSDVTFVDLVGIWFILLLFLACMTGGKTKKDDGKDEKGGDN